MRYLITSHRFYNLEGYKAAARRGTVRPGEYAWIEDMSMRVRLLGVDRHLQGVMTAYTSLGSPKVRARLKARSGFGHAHRLLLGQRQAREARGLAA